MRGKEGISIILQENKRLLKKIKSGDLETLMNWIMERKDKLYRIAWSFLYIHEDVEDVIQNSMIKAYENINTLKEIGFFETWFITILINQCRLSLRSRKRELLREEVIYEDYHIDNYNFFVEINLMDEIFKEVIVLKYISGYTQEEISRILDIPLGTVKSRIYRGIKELRKLLKKEV